LGNEEVREQLKCVVPKLYRYSYDPNPRLAQSMSNILNSLSPRGITSLIDERLSAILDECLTSMGSREWRARQAACQAFASAISGRRANEVMDVIPRMWMMVFRCMDDVKESVVQVGLSAAKSLASLCLRLSDTTQTPSPQCDDAADISIEYLSTKGIENEATPVRQFAITYLLRIIRVTSETVLKKKCPHLVGKLLESLSSLESMGGEMNYLSMHTDHLKMTKDEIDSMRVAAARSSPMQEGLNHITKFICDENREELVKVLNAVIRRGVGLQTQVGSTRFVIQMSLICPNELQLMSGRLLMALPVMFDDISSNVRSSAIEAASHVCRVASAKAIEKYVLVLKEKYMTSGLERVEHRVIAASGLRQLCRIAKEKVCFFFLFFFLFFLFFPPLPLLILVVFRQEVDWKLMQLLGRCFWDLKMVRKKFATH
jgi:proteasome component ECM29